MGITARPFAVFLFGCIVASISHAATLPFGLASNFSSQCGGALGGWNGFSHQSIEKTALTVAERDFLEAYRNLGEDLQKKKKKLSDAEITDRAVEILYKAQDLAREHGVETQFSTIMHTDFGTLEKTTHPVLVVVPNSGPKAPSLAREAARLKDEHRYQIIFDPIRYLQNFTVTYKDASQRVVATAVENIITGSVDTSFYHELTHIGFDLAAKNATQSGQGDMLLSMWVSALEAVDDLPGLPVCQYKRGYRLDEILAYLTNLLLEAEWLFANPHEVTSFSRDTSPSSYKLALASEFANVTLDLLERAQLNNDEVWVGSAITRPAKGEVHLTLRDGGSYLRFTPAFEWGRDLLQVEVVFRDIKMNKVEGVFSPHLIFNISDPAMVASFNAQASLEPILRRARELLTLQMVNLKALSVTLEQTRAALSKGDLVAYAAGLERWRNEMTTYVLPVPYATAKPLGSP